MYNSSWLLVDSQSRTAIIIIIDQELMRKQFHNRLFAHSLLLGSRSQGWVTSAGPLYCSAFFFQTTAVRPLWSSALGLFPNVAIQQFIPVGDNIPQNLAIILNLLL